MMRRDKYLAEMGVGTRQEVKRQIRQGKVTVNGTVVKAADTKIDETCDEVTIEQAGRRGIGDRGPERYYGDRSDQRQETKGSFPGRTTG